MASVVKFPKARMLNVLYEGEGEVILNKIIENRRWSIIHRLIFKLDGVLYETTFSVGATEQQDERAWEYEKEVECTPVEEYQKTVTDYRPIGEAA